ncbi:phosphonopyruvate decarboxylase [Paenibacillus sp. GCM10012307]|uniref:Phosphonopyruvate decarboxylase n=1 Tax=Paenibacillus roseus TaxID=2798579 RepID=A0A934IUS3_9BACL|nr:phosphonopyruvate decarboxylase [Paenibacillus roseus]MBJ6359716.1 phosphonopyruvate decarboxylase [Paenibacillus roseus]
MLSTKIFGEELRKQGFTFYSGVPCSFLKSLINYAINELEYVAAANEGDAVAIASGAYLGGKKSVVLMQNSGLTNAVSPLTSLNYSFRIPILGFVSLRGEPGIPDEPQHELMGKITTQMLELMQIGWEYLSENIHEAREQLVRANEAIDNQKSYFFVVRKGTFDSEALKNQTQSVSQNYEKKTKRHDDQSPSRYEALATINALRDQNTVQLATTGMTGRELYEIEDAACNLYMVGSMGCVGSLGLGLAMSQPQKNIIVIDGDGSLLMRMGSLATNGYYHPNNMLHILLDNHVHDSTGGQNTVSHNMDFINIAASCGYARSIYVHNLQELKEEITAWKFNQTHTFLYMNISRKASELTGRPKIKPYEVKERLRQNIKNATTEVILTEKHSKKHFAQSGTGYNDEKC